MQRSLECRDCIVGAIRAGKSLPQAGIDNRAVRPKFRGMSDQFNRGLMVLRLDRQDSEPMEGIGIFRLSAQDFSVQPLGVSQPPGFVMFGRQFQSPFCWHDLRVQVECGKLQAKVPIHFMR